MSDKLNGGGPAFPFAEYHPGMSLRDWFAGQALNAIIAHGELVDEDGNFTAEPGKGFPAINNFAEFAYVAADAMLAARKAKAEGDAT
jgi:hypothetical protein